MPIAITLDQTWKYQLERERDQDGNIDPENTVFELGTFTPEFEAYLGDDLYQFIMPAGGGGDEAEKAVRDARVNWLDYINRSCAGGIRGWERFADAAGNEVAWESGGKGKGGNPLMASRCLGYLTIADRMEIANELTQRSRLTVKESE